MTLDTIDTSEHIENEMIDQQLTETVQQFPSVKDDGGITPFGFAADLFERKPLLSPRGTRARLNDQYRWWHKQENDMFQGIISGLTKRMQSLPYIIEAPEEDGDQWDNLIRFANFDTWESFLSQLVIAYSTFDIGSFIEIIAPGDPRSEPVGAATGISILDTRRCWPTGDPEFPVIYFDRKGAKHVMHRSRVIQFVDMTERNEELPAWGQSALTRCITPIDREMLLAQYERASLDDMPAPGVAIIRGIAENKFMAAVKRMKDLRDKDDDVFGRLVLLHSLSNDTPGEINVTEFTKEFGGFDPDKISANNARRMANGVGVDLQDFWELSNSGMGTATQSKVLAEKSKGRAFGRLIKGVERMINDILPDDVEFKFKYRNEEEDLERAQTAQAWATVAQMIEPHTTPDERRILLTNQIEALKDATTDKDGNVIRFDDADPKTPGQLIVNGELVPSISEDGEQPPSAAPVVSDNSAAELNKIIIDQMNSAMVDVFTAARMLGQNPAEELRGMYWVGNQLVPKSQLQNIWKYGTLIAPSTTNADLIVEDAPSVLGVDETPPPPAGSTPTLPPSVNPPSVDGDVDTPDDNFVTGEEKDYRRTAARFRRTFNDITKRLKAGTFNKSSARVLIMSDLQKEGKEAYLDGVKKTGVKRPEFDERGQKALTSWLSKQRPFVSDYVDDVASDKYTDKQLENKGLQWVNGSLSDMLFKGMEVAPKQMWRWKTNFAKENCITCLRLHGQVHQMKTYTSRKLLPQSVRLVCHGDNCGCRLIKDDGPAKGRIAAVRFVRRALLVSVWTRRN